MSISLFFRTLKENLKRAAEIREEIKYQGKYVKLYQALGLDLSVARSQVEFKVFGDQIVVESCTGTLEIALNEDEDFEAYKINIPKITEINTVFWRFFITNSAQAGKMARLLIGRDAMFTAKGVAKTGLVNTGAIEINPATEDTLSAFKTANHTDIVALQGAATKDFSTVETDLETISSRVQGNNDDSIKGLLRTLGDAGANPSNTSGKTLLFHVDLSRRYLANPGEPETFTTTPLAGGTTYTSSTRDFNFCRLGFMGLMAFADQASATDGFKIQQSIDDVNWDLDVGKETVSANVGKGIKVAIVGRYARASYTNGGVAQTVFRLGGRYMIA